MTVRRVLFGLLLLLPLAEFPGSYDILRLPLALALGAALLATGPRAVPGRAGAAWLAVLGVQALSLLISPDLDTGLAAVLVTAAAFAAGEASREPGRGEDAAPLLCVVAGVLLAFAVHQRFRGLPVASLLGNSNYAGAFAAMLLPALAAGPRNRLAWFGAAAAGALLALSGSRGGLVGAAAGVAVSAALLWRGGRRRDARILAAVLLVAGALGVAADPVKFLSSETLKSRAAIWTSSSRMAVERPWLGVGAGGFGASYPPYRSAAEARVTQRDAGRAFAEVEDAHSSWIQAFAEGGLPGVLAWLVLVGVAVRLAWRAGPEAAGWAGTATAFLAAGLFNTLSAHAAPALLFGVALGFMDKPGAASKSSGPAVLTAAAALALGALWGAGRIAPDRAYHRAISSADPAERLALAGRGAGWRARYQLGVELDRNGRLAEAAAAYREALAARPYHGASLHNLAIDLLKTGRPEEAERTLAHALEVAPHYFLVHFTLGLRRLEEKKLKEARERFTTAADLNANHAASRYGIGETYLEEGDVPGALPHLRRARELGADVGGALRRDHRALARDPRLAEFQR